MNIWTARRARSKMNMTPRPGGDFMKPYSEIAAMLSHDSKWHEERRKGIGGSDAVKIMAGDWLALWEEKTGRKEPEDLSNVLPVIMGTWTEDLNKYWFEKQTGMKIDMVETSHVTHPTHSFMRANLDARVGFGIFEAKHINAFASIEYAYEKYYPQLQHNMAVCGVPLAYLSVFLGTWGYEWLEVIEDADYQGELIKREQKFWRHVTSDTPPPSCGEPAPLPPALDDMRVVDMCGNNQWAALAADWLTNHGAAKKFKEAEEALKAFIDDDVRHGFGHGIEIKRAKNGALSIRGET